MAARRPVYFPVTYISPYESNEKAHGYDTYGSDPVSDNVRPRTLDRARDEGQAVATGRILIVQAEDAYGLLVYQPVYDVTSGSVEQRRSNLAGYAAGVFIVPNMLRETAEHGARLGMQIVVNEMDLGKGAGGKLLFDSRTPDFKESSEPIVVDSRALTSRQTLQFAGLRWELRFIENTASAGDIVWSLWAVLAGGTLFTGLVGVLLLVVTARTEIVQRLVDDKTEELQNVAEAAQEASRVKSEFLANVSHELRTPLNAVIGYSEMLQEDAEVGRLQTYTEDLKRINDSGRHLMALINDVLDLSKIEAGKTEIELSEFPIGDLIDEVVTIIRPAARARGNTIKVEVDATESVMKSDRTKVKQSMVNLVSNAVKFTEGGQIAVRVSDRRSNDGREVMFRVSDTGIGMTDQEMARVFDDFVQADLSTVRKYGGSGLGLAITKRYSELLGGVVTVSSQPGKGSMFTMTLPGG